MQHVQTRQHSCSRSVAKVCCWGPNSAMMCCSLPVTTTAAHALCCWGVLWEPDSSCGPAAAASITVMHTSAAGLLIPWMRTVPLAAMNMLADPGAWCVSHSRNCVARRSGTHCPSAASLGSAAAMACTTCV